MHSLVPVGQFFYFVLGSPRGSDLAASGNDRLGTTFSFLGRSRRARSRMQFHPERSGLGGVAFLAVCLSSHEGARFPAKRVSRGKRASDSATDKEARQRSSIRPSIFSDTRWCVSQRGFQPPVRVGDDPLGTAASFAEAGATWLHVVDLEGARGGAPVHLDLLPNLAALGLSVQYGGGLRRSEDIAATLEAGASRAMVGSLLGRRVNGPQLCREAFGQPLSFLR
jgi:hypothetical protein